MNKKLIELLEFKRMPGWVQVLVIVVLSKILFLIVWKFGSLIELTMKETLLLWDGAWYLELLEKGYYLRIDGGQSTIAFPPLFSLMGKLVSLLRISPAWSLVLVSNACSSLGLILLWGLLKKQFDETTATRTIVLLLFSPIGWIFHLAYSESLFLLISVLFFKALEHTKIIIAGLFGGLLVLTRVSGFLFVIPLLAGVWFQRKLVAKKFFALILVLLMGSLWLVYLGIQGFDPWLVFGSQSAWDRGFYPFPGILILAVTQIVNFVLYTPDLPLGIWLVSRIPNFLDVILILFFVSLVLLHFRKLPNVYTLFSLVYCLWMISFPPFSFDRVNFPPVTLGALRYLLGIWPVILLLVLQYKKHFDVILHVSVALHIIYLAYFVNAIYIP